MRSVFGLAVVAHGLRLEESVEANANPIRRIVTLLQNMQTEVRAEGEKEKDLYEKFMCYCKGNTDGLQKDVEAGMAQAKALAAEVAEKSARKEQLEGELTDHQKDRHQAQDALATANSIREKENADYQKASGDAGQNLAALNKAIDLISKGMGVSLLQAAPLAAIQRVANKSTSVSEEEKEAVLSFLSGTTSGPYGDYSASSGEIVGILKTMKDDMEKDLGSVVDNEKAAQAAFDELSAAKSDEIKAAGAAIEKKSVRVGELAVEVAQASNARKDALNEHGANTEFLANLAEDCETKTAEWDERSKTRNEELSAVSEAIKVLNDDDALDMFKKTLPSAASVPQVSLLQRGSYSEQRRRTEAYAFLQSASDVSDNRSTQLSLIGYVLKVGKVNFAKVVKMIDDMVAHLGKEQDHDDQEREWCAAEFDSSEDKSKDLARKVSDQTAAIEEANADLAAAKDSIAATKAKIAELDEAVKEATAQRKAENAEYVETTADNNAAKQLIGKAKNRLNKFYNPALYKPPPKRELTEEERIARNMGETIDDNVYTTIRGTQQLALVGAKPDPAPATWTGGYKNKGQKSGGVIALMDLLLKDLDTQVTEGQKDEEAAQTDYQKMMGSAKSTRAAESQSLVELNSKKASLETTINDTKQARSATADEAQQTKQYISQLHGQCDFLVQNYDYRKEARASERDALKNAKAVLSGANYA